MQYTNHSVGKSNSRGHHESRRAYASPHLERLGDVRDITFGGSPGAGDSGAELIQRAAGASSSPYDLYDEETLP
ncbi:MAG: hypothetical protein ACP5JJ_08185 [Anaerolineae bacterium]